MLGDTLGAYLGGYWGLLASLGLEGSPLVTGNGPSNMIPSLNLPSIHLNGPFKPINPITYISL